MTKLNGKMVQRAIDGLASVVVQYHSDAHYSHDAVHVAARRMVATGFTREHLDELVVLRDKYFRKLEKDYKVKLSSGLSAFAEDTEALLKSKKVPQKMRVAVGMWDAVIGCVMMSSMTVEHRGNGVTVYSL